MYTLKEKKKGRESIFRSDYTLCTAMYSYISLYSYISGRGSTINHQSCLRVNKNKELDAASSRWIRKGTRRVWLEFINFLLKKKEIRDEYRADKFQNERELNFSRSKSDIFSIASVEAYSKRNEWK